MHIPAPQLSFDNLPYEVRELIFDNVLLGHELDEEEEQSICLENITPLIRALRSLPLSYDHVLEKRYSHTTIRLSKKNDFTIHDFEWSPRAQKSVTRVSVKLTPSAITWSKGTHLKPANPYPFRPAHLTAALSNSPQINELTIGYNMNFFDYPLFRQFLSSFPTWIAAASNLKRVIIHIPSFVWWRAPDSQSTAEDIKNAQRDHFERVRIHVDKQVRSSIGGRYLGSRQMPEPGCGGYYRYRTWVEIWEWVAKEDEVMDWRGVKAKDYDTWTLWNSGESLRFYHGWFLTHIEGGI